MQFANEVTDQERAKDVGRALRNATILLNRAHSDLVMMYIKRDKDDPVGRWLRRRAEQVKASSEAVENQRRDIVVKFCYCHEGSVCSDVCEQKHHAGCYVR